MTKARDIADGTPTINTSNFVTKDENGIIEALDGSALTNLTSSNLTGSLPNIDGSSLTGIDAGGVTMAETRVLTGDITIPVNGGVINCDSVYTGDNSGGFGTGLTNSAGEYSFPETGHYLLTAFVTARNSSSNYFLEEAYFGLQAYNGSSWSDAAQGVFNVPTYGSYNVYGNGKLSYLFDITDTAAQKFRLTFVAYGGGSSRACVVSGAGDKMKTGFQIVKLADT